MENYYEPAYIAALEIVERERNRKDGNVSCLRKFFEQPMPLQKELIAGVLRKGHKMILSGASKCGKTFCLIGLAVTIANGYKWLSFRCEKGKVLYIDFEVSVPTIQERFRNVWCALKGNENNLDNIDVWSMRGENTTLTELTNKVVKKCREQKYDAIIFDPIYKILTGDENSATDMGEFLRNFDKICEQTGCSVIMCHHFSKGTQGNRKAIDRASGSGVLARDPDAIITLSELSCSGVDKEIVENLGNKVPLRMEFSLREFPNPSPIDMWFDYPVFKLDNDGVLAKAGIPGSRKANLAASSKRNTQTDRKNNLDKAFNETCNNTTKANSKDMAIKAEVTEKTIINWVKEFDNKYLYSKGVVHKIA